MISCPPSTAVGLTAHWTPIRFHWYMYTRGNYHNGGCHWQFISHHGYFVSYRTLVRCGFDRADSADITLHRSHIAIIKWIMSLAIHNMFWLVSAECAVSHVSYLRKWRYFFLAEIILYAAVVGLSLRPFFVSLFTVSCFFTRCYQKYWYQQWSAQRPPANQNI